MEQQPTIQKEILITNLTIKNDGFAVVPETGEGVYIPPGVTMAANLIAGEKRMAKLIRNTPGRQTEYMGIYVEPIGGDPDEAEYDEPSPLLDKLADLDERIMDALEDAESYLTTREIAREVSEQTVMVRDRLNRLFTQGKVARADIFHHSNRRAMNVLWATDPEKFL
jgi:hypothetical protein